MMIRKDGLGKRPHVDHKSVIIFDGDVELNEPEADRRDRRKATLLQVNGSYQGSESFSLK